MLKIKNMLRTLTWGSINGGGVVGGWGVGGGDYFALAKFI